MPKFYFHLRHRGEFLRDHTGADFPNAELARGNGIQLGSQLCRVGGEMVEHSAIEIADESGKLLEVIKVRDCRATTHGSALKPLRP